MEQTNKIKSFKSFSDVLAAESATKLKEENNGKKAELSTKIASILDSMEITSLDGLDKDQKTKLIEKLFGEAESTEEVEPEVNAEQDEDEEVSEALKVEGKRDAKKVVTQYNKIFNKVLVDFGAMSSESKLGTIKYLFQEAMEDANFSREGNAIAKFIKGSIKPLEIKMPGLGGHFIKIGPNTIKTMLDKYYSDIANAAGWSGMGIVEGTALYLETLNQEKMGYGLITAFNSKFEGNDLRVDIDTKLNEAKSTNESTVIMDATDPDSKDLAKLLKKYKVTMKVVNKEGPSGFPEIELKGKRKDLVSVLASEDGWDDADLAEYIEESNEELTEEMPAHAKKMKKDGVSDEEIKKMHPEVEDEELKEGKVNLKELQNDFSRIMSNLEEERMYGDPDMKAVIKLLKADKLEDAATEFLSSFADQDGGEGRIDWEAYQSDVEDAFSVYVNESKINEAVTIFEKDLADMIKEIKRGYGWIDPEAVEDTWGNSSNSISFGMVENEIYKRLISAGLLAYAGDDEEEAGKYVKSLKELGIKESVVNEAEINSDKEFKEYAETVLQKAFGDEYDENKANDVIDGILSKVDGDYGAAVGMLTSSLGESVELDEKIDEILCKDGKKHDWKQIDKDGTSQCNNCGLLKSE